MKSTLLVCARPNTSRLPCWPYRCQVTTFVVVKDLRDPSRECFAPERSRWAPKNWSFPRENVLQFGAQCCTSCSRSSHPSVDRSLKTSLPLSKSYSGRVGMPSLQERESLDLPSSLLEGPTSSWQRPTSPPSSAPSDAFAILGGFHNGARASFYAHPGLLRNCVGFVSLRAPASGPYRVPAGLGLFAESPSPGPDLGRLQRSGEVQPQPSSSPWQPPSVSLP